MTEMTDVNVELEVFCFFFFAFSLGNIFARLYSPFTGKPAASETAVEIKVFWFIVDDPKYVFCKYELQNHLKSSIRRKQILTLSLVFIENTFFDKESKSYVFFICIRVHSAGRSSTPIK